MSCTPQLLVVIGFSTKNHYCKTTSLLYSIISSLYLSTLTTLVALQNKNKMKLLNTVFLTSSALLFAGIPSANAQCKLIRRWGRDGRDLDEYAIEENFRIDVGASTTCEVRCSAGTDMRLTMRNDEVPTQLEFDAQSEYALCQGRLDEALRLSLANDEGRRVSILGYRIEGKSIGTLWLNCDCSDSYVDSSSCFSKGATVQVEGVGSVAMEDLQVGQKVLTGTGNYQPVYAFGHYNPEGLAMFVQFHTKDSMLEMTGNHLVFKDGQAVRADSIQVGDVLSSGPVTKITSAPNQGLYMPLTKDGTIVVDGILASSYVSIADDVPGVVEKSAVFLADEQSLLHWWLAPYRMMCMGISANFCTGSFTEEGISNWLMYGKNFAEFAETQHAVVQYATGVVVFLVFAAFVAVENILGSPLASMATGVATMAAFSFYKKMRRGDASDAMKKVV